MTGIGGPLVELAHETAQHIHTPVPDFPFVMLTVPAWWVIVNPDGDHAGIVTGGSRYPTAELAFTVHTPNHASRRARLKGGWTVRPATADEIAAYT